MWPVLLSKWEQLQCTERYRAMLGAAVRKGVPFSIRGEAWYVRMRIELLSSCRKILSGGNELQKKNPGVYEVCFRASILFFL
jgi:hypothetical protein